MFREKILCQIPKMRKRAYMNDNTVLGSEEYNQLPKLRD